MSNIIGLGGSLHDFAACLINENNEIIAIEDERITRNRYGLGELKPHSHSIEYCLNNSGLNLNDLDFIVGDDMIDDLFFPDREKLNHHMAHAYSVFFTSPFKESAILILDGVGSLVGVEEDRETTTYAYGVNNNINVISKIIGTPSSYRHSPLMPRVRSNSLGEFYRFITEIIGFDFLQAGKTMGLFPYGDDRYVENFLSSISLKELGHFEINVSGESGLIEKILKIKKSYKGKNSFVLNSSLAYAAQITLEIIVEHCLEYLWQCTKSENICLAGGVILNSVVNGKLKKISKFKNIHIISAPGDNGAAIGAAIYGKNLKHSIDPLALTRFDFTPYLGAKYSQDHIKKAINSNNFYKPVNLESYIAESISKGLVIACFQGRSEFGPRALGNRSILADPRDAKMKDKINDLKGREWFRPVAPVVPENLLNTYFEAKNTSPYMQYVFPVTTQYIDLIKGATHVDNSARVQSVNFQSNNFFYNILEEFGNITNIPVVINTSFNIKGQPIVETPEDAVEAFINSKIDLLVIDKFVLKK